MVAPKRIKKLQEENSTYIFLFIEILVSYFYGNSVPVS